MKQLIHSTGNTEWYSPAKYVTSARLVMGTIDLDPASCEVAQENVKAKQFYSLKYPYGDHQDRKAMIKSEKWKGNIWLNPPFSRGIVSNFINKLIDDIPTITAYICLVNNSTETQWFQQLLIHSSALCFPDKRIRFDTTNGKRGRPLVGQAFFYRGENSKAFIREFSKYGFCIEINPKKRKKNGKMA